MVELKFSPRAEKDLESLPPHIRIRIIRKLKENAALDNPLARAESLVNHSPTTHRFRIGNYRAPFYVERGVVFIERISRRDKAYDR